MRRTLTWIVLLALLALVAWALAGALFGEHPVHVEVAVVERGTVESSVANTKAGTVRARRRAMLSPGTAGLVSELLVERGQRVEKGALLLRLDQATQRAALALAERAQTVAEARKLRACVAADRASRELERNRELFAQRIVSDDVLDRYESAHATAAADCAVAAAEVEQARAQIDAARVELEKTELFAPFTATIAEVNAEVGEWVTPSVALMAAPDLIDAIDPASLYVSAPMDEVDAALLAVGARARVTLDSHPGRTFPAKVVRVAPYVLDLEEQNRTVEVEVELDDTALASSLLPGTSADVEVILDVIEDAVRIPSLALFEGDRCWVVDADGLVHSRPVELGLRNWTWAEVRGGLDTGERVVVAFDADDLEDGARVEVGDADTSDSQP